jgi:hypothetical protein
VDTSELNHLLLSKDDPTSHTDVQHTVTPVSLQVHEVCACFEQHYITDHPQLLHEFETSRSVPSKVLMMWFELPLLHLFSKGPQASFKSGNSSKSSFPL